MAEKRFTPVEAAIAVLAKAKELYGASVLAKSEPNGANPDAAADAQLGEKVEQDVQQHEASNADPAHAEAPMKGHIKLAKFQGRMEHKKEQKAKSMAKDESLGQAIGFPGAGPAPGPSPAPMAKKESDFDKLKNKMKAKEGYSEKTAEAAAAVAGRKELGQAEMTRRSVAGREK